MSEVKGSEVGGSDFDEVYFYQREVHNADMEIRIDRFGNTTHRRIQIDSLYSLNEC